MLIETEDGSGSENDGQEGEDYQGLFITKCHEVILRVWDQSDRWFGII